MGTISQSSKCSSASSADTIANFIGNLDIAVVQSLALAVRTQESVQSSTPPSPAGVLSCVVTTPPEHGAYNIVYHLQFSDRISWVIRIPFEEWGADDARCMRLDIVAMEYICSHTSIPIPRLHSYSCTKENPLGHPYMIMDKVQGTCLYDTWNDPSWWTGERRKENLFESLAGYMTELAGLEFDKIGRLDRTDADGAYFVAPFPSGLALVGEAGGPHEDFGPFDSTRACFTAVVNLRRPLEKDPKGKAWCALTQFFIDSLLEEHYDCAPFTFDHPDFNTQNIFVDDTGRVVGIIDWDGVSIQPRQIGALCYPTFVTLDWNPGDYGADPEEMHGYRQKYTEAIRVASNGKLDAVVRNSHVAECVCACASSGSEAGTILIRLGEYAFGSATVTLDVLEGLEHGSWLTSPANEVARIKLWNGPADDDPLRASDDADDHATTGKGGKNNGWVQRIGGWVRRKVLNVVRSWTTTANTTNEARKGGHEAVSQRFEPTPS
ncbi:hypothetical protein BV20DRAFT_968579 [Pilatotrama ljubarskyi]|nr:hypothetical protein BV20DRAFT_968579 [Pilatotrama ljubarskyi]